MKVLVFILFSSIFNIYSQENDPYRLSHDVEPVFQFIHLNLNPDEEPYSGYTEIELNIKTATSEFRMHGKDFNITKLELLQNNTQIQIQHEFQEYDFLKIISSKTLSPGSYQLRCEFNGLTNTKGEGIIRYPKDSLNYMYTQMEAIYARQFFPCFDEPNFKIPIQVEISAPKDFLVVSNTPEEKVTDGESTKTVLFKKTKPIPIYLMAFAVGPFETADIPGLSVPGRVIVPKGYIEKSQYIKNITAQILKSLEEYFGVPYPYEKLDFVSVLNYNAGAMENVGLIVYQEHYLVDPPQRSLQSKYSAASVVTHEIAHMWFGNLVTLEWWSDTWLNEGLTSWVEGEIMVKEFPQLKPMDDMLRNFNWALRTDRTENTTPIAREIKGNESPDVAFDALSYGKSQVVFRMLKNWVGEDNFKKGLKIYFEKYKWKNTTLSDFIESMSVVTDNDISRMINDFVTQPGIPVVSAEVQGNSLKISQSRLTTVGTEKKFTETWLIPLQIKISDGEKTYIKNILLDKKQDTYVFEDLKKIDWFHLKANFIGYFLVTSNHENIEKAIQSGKLSNTEIQDIFVGLNYGFYSGKTHPVNILKLVNSFKNTSDISLATALGSILGKLRIFGEKNGSALFKTYMDQTALPLLSTMGLEVDLSLTNAERSAKGDLILCLKQNPKIISKVSDLGRKYLTTETISSANYRVFLYGLFLHNPDDSLYNFTKEKILNTTIQSERRNLLFAIARFPGKYIQQTLDFTIEGDLEPNDRIRILLYLTYAAYEHKLNTGKGTGYNIIRWARDHEDFYRSKVSEDVLNGIPILIRDMDDLLTFEKLYPEDTRPKSMQVDFEKRKSDITTNAKLLEQYYEDVKKYMNEFDKSVSVKN